MRIGSIRDGRSGVRLVQSNRNLGLANTLASRLGIYLIIINRNGLNENFFFGVVAG